MLFSMSIVYSQVEDVVGCPLLSLSVGMGALICVLGLDLLLLCVRSLRPILITLCDMFDLCQERVYVAHWFGRPLNA